MQYSNFELTINQGICHVEFNRPQQGNSITDAWLQEVLAVVHLCERDDAIRCLAFSSRGPYFSVGADLGMFRKNSDDLPNIIREVTVPFNSINSRLHRLSKPVIAAIQGPVAGGGLSMMLNCDYVIANDKAKFSVAYVGIGGSPDGGLCRQLPKLIGERRAKDMIMRNTQICTDTALDWGLINECVAEEALSDRLQQIALEFAIGPTAAYKQAKSLIALGSEITLETTMELEARAFAELGHTNDVKEGVTAIFEKRKPSFTGS